jgi:hypothetical protein
MNQCDGCRAGMSLKDNIHYGPDNKPFCYCTKELYEPIKPTYYETDKEKNEANLGDGVEGV